MRLAKRKPTRWQTEVAWPQRRQWEKFETDACDCGCGLTAAACLRAGAISGEQLLARAREGQVVMPALPRARLRMPTFKCSLAQDICRLIQEQCIDRGAKAVRIKHSQMAELCRRGLGRGSAHSSHNAVHQAKEAGWIEIVDRHVPGEDCRRCDGDGKRGDGSDCAACSGTGKRPDHSRRAQTRLKGQACGQERAANYYRPGQAMLLALDKTGWSAAALMRKAELAAQAERGRTEQKAELERRAEHERAGDRRQLERRDTERRNRLRAVVDVVLSSDEKRPDLTRIESLSPERSSVLYDRVGGAPSAQSRRPRQAAGEFPPPPAYAAEPAPTARAEELAIPERPTERPTAALSRVSLLREDSPSGAEFVAIAPPVAPKGPERPGEGADGPLFPEAPEKRRRPSVNRAPPVDEAPIEEFVLRMWAAHQRRLSRLEHETPGSTDDPANGNERRAGPAEEDRHDDDEPDR